MNAYWNYSDDLPRLPDIKETRGGPRDLLQARGALLAAAERIEANSIGAGRAMTAEEQRDMDDCLSQIKGITEDLAEYKRQRIADAAGSGFSPVFAF